MHFLTILGAPCPAPSTWTQPIALTASYLCSVKCVLLNKCLYDVAANSLHHDCRPLVKNKDNKTFLIKFTLIYFFNLLEVSKRCQSCNHRYLQYERFFTWELLERQILCSIPDLLHLNVHLVKFSGGSYILWSLRNTDWIC